MCAYADISAPFQNLVCWLTEAAAWLWIISYATRDPGTQNIIISTGRARQDKTRQDKADTDGNTGE